MVEVLGYMLTPASWAAVRRLLGGGGQAVTCLLPPTMPSAAATARCTTAGSRHLWLSMPCCRTGAPVG
jgi:hypothetical protein